jgi:superfamily I DNA and RNA helicase
VVSSALRSKEIASHLAGVTSSRDEMFVGESVAITHIYRAKGNEAAMVYVVNADECFGGLQLAKKRNTLFTAITRSKGWVRVCGVGQAMQDLTEEFQAIVSNNFMLQFDYPTAEQIAPMKRIHRDRTVDEQRKIEKNIGGIVEIIEMVKAGELSLEQLPSDIIQEFRRILTERQ